MATEPNTSKPFYKVNKMEPATAYPRLNATSYFYSSNVSSFCLSGPVSLLPFPLQWSTLLQTVHRCHYHLFLPSHPPHRVVLPGSCSTKLRTDKRNAISRAKESCIRTYSSVVDRMYVIVRGGLFNRNSLKCHDIYLLLKLWRMYTSSIGGCKSRHAFIWILKFFLSY